MPECRGCMQGRPRLPPPHYMDLGLRHYKWRAHSKPPVMPQIWIILVALWCILDDPYIDSTTYMIMPSEIPNRILLSVCQRDDNCLHVAISSHVFKKPCSRYIIAPMSTTGGSTPTVFGLSTRDHPLVHLLMYNPQHTMAASFATTFIIIIYIAQGLQQITAPIFKVLYPVSHDCKFFTKCPCDNTCLQKDNSSYCHQCVQQIHNCTLSLRRNVVPNVSAANMQQRCPCDEGRLQQTTQQTCAYTYWPYFVTSFVNLILSNI